MLAQKSLTIKMKKQNLLLIIFSLLISTQAFSKVIHVRGYTTRKGTYKAPHYRTNNDHSRSNNWSNKGNQNPVTGKKGYKS